MNLKVLFVIFLCLLSASMICNVAIPTVKATEEWHFEGFTLSGSIGYLTNNGTEPNGGDPIGGGWPQ